MHIELFGRAPSRTQTVFSVGVGAVCDIAEGSATTCWRTPVVAVVHVALRGGSANVRWRLFAVC